VYSETIQASVLHITNFNHPFSLLPDLNPPPHTQLRPLAKNDSERLPPVPANIMPYMARKSTTGRLKVLFPLQRLSWPPEYWQS